MNGRRNIAFLTNAVSHLHHEMKVVNIWLVFTTVYDLMMSSETVMKRSGTPRTVRVGSFF